MRDPVVYIGKDIRVTPEYRARPAERLQRGVFESGAYLAELRPLEKLIIIHGKQVPEDVFEAIIHTAEDDVTVREQYVVAGVIAALHSPFLHIKDRFPFRARIVGAVACGRHSNFCRGIFLEELFYGWVRPSSKANKARRRNEAGDLFQHFKIFCIDNNLFQIVAAR